MIYGSISGVGYSLVGWQKNKKDKGFDWIQLVKCVAIGVLVGAAAGYTGQDFNMLVTGSMGVGVTKVVDLVIGFFKK